MGGVEKGEKIRTSFMDGPLDKFKKWLFSTVTTFLRSRSDIDE